jgi:hypothetical protein
MSTWTNDELQRIADAEELEIAPVRRNGELRRATPIWVVRAGDELRLLPQQAAGHPNTSTRNDLT